MSLNQPRQPDTEGLQDRMLRLLHEAGVDPLTIPIDGPLDATGYAAVRQPLDVVDDRIVTDWQPWNPGLPPELITDLVATFDQYQAARRGPIGRPA